MNQEQIITTDANAEAVAKILPKIQDLEVALLSQAPEVAHHLSEINEDLRQYPDLTWLLSDEQIKPIYSALREMSDVEITTRAAKKKTAPKVSAESKALLNALL